MRKPLLFLFAILATVILVEAAYLYSSSSFSSPQTSSAPSDRFFALATPTLAAKAGFQVVSQKEGDVLGRTIVYKLSNTITTEDKDYAVGIFQGWEKVKGSEDRYLLLQNIDDGKANFHFGSGMA